MLKEPIRIAQVVGKMNGGGVEAVVMNYYRHIDKNRIQFDFIVDSDSKQIPKADIEALGGKVFEIPPYSHPIAYQRELKKLLKDGQWTIVHSHINALSVFPLHAAKKTGVPVRIAHSHNTAGKGEHARNILKNLLKLFANVYPTHRFACGELAGKWLFGKNRSFEIIHNAIELDKFAFDADVRRQMRSELGLTDDQLVIGHIGRFMRQKNHVFLLKAFAKLCETRADCVLVLVGTGELVDDMKRLAEDLGISEKVRFLGQRSDANRLYQAFDVFALPSLYEGLCVVGIEAQSSGLPCLFSDTITREVDLTGTVRFLPIDDESIWVRNLEGIRHGERNEADRGCFSQYDIGKAANRLADLYESMKGTTHGE